MPAEFSAPAFAFLVFGCRLNQAEAELWQKALAERGWRVAQPEEADVLCVHSCAVTAPAAREVLRRIRAFKRKRPNAKVVLSGCASTVLPAGTADLVLPHEKKGEWLDAVLAFAGGGCASEPSGAPGTLPKKRTRASLIVEDGCDRFCAYCIVPHLRGKPSSTPMAELLRRAEELFAQGYREIVLTGCHLALYRDPETGAGLVELLRRLCDVRGEGRFRLSSLEPCEVEGEELINVVASAGGRVCAFLHLPIQTASDALLKRMGRRYTAQDLRRFFDRLCEAVPLCGLGADWIAGLPGETPEDAEASRAFLAQYPFTAAHIFPYSRRPGTPAADFPDQVPSEEIKRRAEALTAVAESTRKRTLPNFIGQELTVIPERIKNGFREGWSEQHIRCRLPAESHRGELTFFRPTRLDGDTLL